MGPRSALPQARRSDIAEQILSATLDVLATGGMRAVTHRRVAERAGVAPGLITYYFSSTPELLRAAHVAAVEREVAFYERRLEEVRRLPDGDEPLVEFLVGEILQWCTPARRQAAAALWVLSLDAIRDDHGHDIHTRWVEGPRPMFELIAERARAADPATDGALIEAMALGLGFDVTLAAEPDRERIEQVVREQLRRVRR
jgi:DNA-binding transcriptional regulator YbjK